MWVRRALVAAASLLGVKAACPCYETGSYCQYGSGFCHGSNVPCDCNSCGTDIHGQATAACHPNPTFAFTYTTPNQTWAKETSNYNSIFVYAGDAEFYCRGMPTARNGGGASNESTRCQFSGSEANAFIYYNDFAKAAASSLKASGKQVYINFDGRISPVDQAFVPDFSLLTTGEIADMASITAAHVCDDPNVDGMAWDVEPFDNNQVGFFSALDKLITACGKRWGVFAFGEDLNEEMWTQGLGQSGFLFDSTYDLNCSDTVLPPFGCQPCQCTPPDIYKQILPKHINAVMTMAKKYNKPYRLMVSGSGSTQIYETLTTEYCMFAGGGASLDYHCPYTIDDWMRVALDTFDTLQVRSDPRFEGLGVYGYTTTNGGGFSPTTPPSATIQTLIQRGYLPLARPLSEASVKPLAERNNDAISVGNYNNPIGSDHFMLGSPRNFAESRKCVLDADRPVGCPCDNNRQCFSQKCDKRGCKQGF